MGAVFFAPIGLAAVNWADCRPPLDGLLYGLDADGYGKRRISRRSWNSRVLAARPSPALVAVDVRTLFGCLFSLVWARELFNMTQTNTWMTCVLVVALWAFAPLLFIPSKVIGPIGIVRAVCGVTGVLILLFISMEVPLEISLLSIPAAFLLAVMIGARHP